MILLVMVFLIIDEQTGDVRQINMPLVELLLLLPVASLILHLLTFNDSCSFVTRIRLPLNRDRSSEGSKIGLKMLALCKTGLFHTAC